MNDLSEVFIERFNRQNQYCLIIYLKSCSLFTQINRNLKNLEEKLGISVSVVRNFNKNLAIPNKTNQTQSQEPQEPQEPQAFIRVFSLNKNYLIYYSLTVMIQYYSYKRKKCFCNLSNTKQICTRCFKIKKYIELRKPLLHLFFS